MLAGLGKGLPQRPPRPSVVRSGHPRLSWGNCSLSCHSPTPRLPPLPLYIGASAVHRRWLAGLVRSSGPQHFGPFGPSPLRAGQAEWLEADHSGSYQGIEWYSTEFYQQFVEDFDEFAKVKDTPDLQGRPP